MKKPNLYLITAEYPYGRGETFLENEIQVLSRRFNKIYLLPVKKSNGARPVPDNAIVLEVLTSCPSKSMSRICLENPFYILKLLCMELLHTNRKRYFLQHIRSINGFLSQNIHKAKHLETYLSSQTEANSVSVFYSFWMDEGAVIYSVLKDKKIIDSFVFRVLGYDLYDERREGGYMPFRYFNFKMTKKIFCISKDGFSYLMNKKIFTNKLELSYLSVFDHGINPFDNNETFTLVSCSNFLPLKRVHLIIEILKKVKNKTHWIHFGDGWGSKEELLAKAAQLPENIQVELKGHKDNKYILDFYSTHSINLCIHLSETEGGAPVALQEAASFGIPLLGTNAGGIPEIVTEETGVLIPVNFDIDEVADLINNFKDSYRNTLAFRSQVRAFWSKNFNAEINYNKLCDEIIN